MCILFFIVEVSRIIIADVKLGCLVTRYKDSRQFGTPWYANLQGCLLFIFKSSTRLSHRMNEATNEAARWRGGVNKSRGVLSGPIGYLLVG